MVILKIILELLAGIAVFFEQIRSKDRYRSILLLIAGIVMICSAIYTYLDYDIEKKSEIERKADLLTIQKMSSSFNDLAFEFELKKVDSLDAIAIDFQIETSVRTNRSGTGLFADYIRIGYSPDSGWFTESSTFQRYKNLLIEIDKENNRVRFVLTNYGLSLKWNTGEIQPANNILNNTGWEPTSLADLGRLRIGLSAWAFKDVDMRRTYENEWCPIEKVRIFVNSFDLDNLLFVAERNIKYDSAKDPCYYYLPKWHKDFGNPNGRDFLIEPLHIRDAILNSL